MWTQWDRVQSIRYTWLSRNSTSSLRCSGIAAADLQPHNSESSQLRGAMALATVNSPGFLTPVEAFF